MKTFVLLCLKDGGNKVIAETDQMSLTSAVEVFKSTVSIVVPTEPGKSLTMPIPLDKEGYHNQGGGISYVVGEYHQNFQRL